jgi:hypothetical protein
VRCRATKAGGAKKVALVVGIVATCQSTLFGPFTQVPPWEPARGMANTFTDGKRASELGQQTN